MYKCAICGKEYEDIEGRIKCETACLAQRKDDEAKRKQLELDNAKKDRKAKIDKAYKEFEKLANAYLDDYGYVEYLKMVQEYLKGNCVKAYKNPTIEELEKFWKEW